MNYRRQGQCQTCNQEVAFDVEAAIGRPSFKGYTLNVRVNGDCPAEDRLTELGIEKCPTKKGLADACFNSLRADLEGKSG